MKGTIVLVTILRSNQGVRVKLLYLNKYLGYVGPKRNQKTG